ncbi:GxxExxY protein [bacterium]|nr:GxxExxY protein [bacterium]
MELSDELKGLCYRIIGICMEVHRELGPGFPEEYYQKALEHEFAQADIGFEPQKPIIVSYKDIQVGLNFLDFLIDEKLILEIKSVKEINDIHRFQVIKYFASSEYMVALLINFGGVKLEYEQMLPPMKIQQRKMKGDNYKSA